MEIRITILKEEFNSITIYHYIENKIMDMKKNGESNFVGFTNGFALISDDIRDIQRAYAIIRKYAQK